jgi:hypothetical protein
MTEQPLMSFAWMTASRKEVMCNKRLYGFTNPNAKPMMGNDDSQLKLVENEGSGEYYLKVENDALKQICSERRDKTYCRGGVCRSTLSRNLYIAGSLPLSSAMI